MAMRAIGTRYRRLSHSKTARGKEGVVIDSLSCRGYSSPKKKREESAMAIKQIIPPQAHETLDKDSTVIYLDVRTVPEFTAGHPQRGMNIPVVFFDQRTRQPIPNPDFLTVVEAHIPKAATVIVGCQAGGRSQAGAQITGAAAYI